eukprot:3358033-Heterocapsa_arctica.AAC.1
MIIVCRTQNKNLSLIIPRTLIIAVTHASDEHNYEQHAHYIWHSKAQSTNGLYQSKNGNTNKLSITHHRNGNTDKVVTYH